MKCIYKVDNHRTCFYIKVDKEDSLGCLGLLLDANLIPIGMKLFSENQSEKEVIDSLKKQYQITGKTIHVADNGLNCTQNIAYSVKNNDAYLFSKSINELTETEKAWVLLDSDVWVEVRDKNNTLLYKYKSCIDKYPYTEKRLLTYHPKRAQYNLLVTSETNMSDQDIYEAYHNLRIIEESFKIMKSDLNEESAFPQKDNIIKGYFLIGYLAMLLERILQFKVLNNQYSTSQIINLYLTERQMKQILSYKI